MRDHLEQAVFLRLSFFNLHLNPLLPLLLTVSLGFIMIKKILVLLCENQYGIF